MARKLRRAAASAKSANTDAAPDATFVETFRAQRAARRRPYQQLAFAALRSGIKRALLGWHRRAGKDDVSLDWTREQMDERPATYWHLFPKAVQAKKALWHGVDPATGKRFLDLWFPDRVYQNDQDMLLRLPNGAIWQLGGSDSFDRLVGSNVLGVVFSEWALANPLAWEYIRPILVENGGWALFPTTFRGRNHAWQMAKKLASSRDWYVDLRTAQQGDLFRYPQYQETQRVDGSPVVAYADVEREISEGMSVALAKQEFYCDPLAAREGAFYGASTAKILEQRGSVLHDATYPVVAAWNLEGMPANVSCVCVQSKGNERAIIGSRSWYFTSLGEAFAEVADMPWPIRRHVIAAEPKEPVYLELFAREFGVRRVEPVAPLSRQGKISAVMNAMLERTSIDTLDRPYAQEGFTNNELVVDSLNGYRLRELEQGDGRDNFSDAPLDTYERYLAQAVELYATWDFFGGTRDVDGLKRRLPDYSLSDRHVI